MTMNNNEKKNITVGLFGTCADSQWREKFIPMLDSRVKYFNPVVKEWNEEAMQNEIHHRKHDEIMLYVITPCMEGIYSIAEVVDDSNKRNDVIFCYLEEEGDKKFDAKMIKSLKAVARLVTNNGSYSCTSLEEVAKYINEICIPKYLD